MGPFFNILLNRQYCPFTSHIQSIAIRSSVHSVASANTFQQVASIIIHVSLTNMMMHVEFQVWHSFLQWLILMWFPIDISVAIGQHHNACLNFKTSLLKFARVWIDQRADPRPTLSCPGLHTRVGFSPAPVSPQAQPWDQPGSLW